MVITTNNNTAQHHGTITHLVLDLLHRLELFYEKQKTSRRNEMRDKRYRVISKQTARWRNEMRDIIETISKRDGIMR
jgi:hypothetical protein